MSMDEFIRCYEEAPFEWIDQEIFPIMPTVSGHGHVSKIVAKAMFPSELKAIEEVYYGLTFISMGWH
jgi:hypothetical protein